VQPVGHFIGAGRRSSDSLRPLEEINRTYPFDRLAPSPKQLKSRDRTKIVTCDGDYIHDAVKFG
jgi:hypothetical protein